MKDSSLPYKTGSSGLNYYPAFSRKMEFPRHVMNLNYIFMLMSLNGRTEASSGTSEGSHRNI